MTTTTPAPQIPTTAPLREAIARFDAEHAKAAQVQQGLGMLAAKVEDLSQRDLLPLDRHDVGFILAGIHALIDEEAARLGLFKQAVSDEVAALLNVKGGETC